MAPLPAVIAFELDGRAVEARAGETLFQVARRHGIDIPHLCYRDGLRADGNCRACVVEIEGERVLAPSCCRAPAPGWPQRGVVERRTTNHLSTLSHFTSRARSLAYEYTGRLFHVS